MSFGLFSSPLSGVAAGYAPVAENGAGLTTALSATTPKALAVPPGTLAATTAISVPSQATLSFTAGTTFNSAVPSGDGFHDAIFYTDKVATLRTTLSTGATVGSATVSVASVTGLSTGNWIAIYVGSGDAAMSYKIVTVNAGPKTLVLDRPVMFAFASGTAVYSLTPTQEVRINFGGSTFNVTSGSRDFWAPYNIDCHYSDGTFNSSTATFGPNLDLGSLRCSFADLIANFVANTTAAYPVEFGEDTRLIRCASYGAFQQGFRISGFNVTIEDPSARSYVQIGFAFQESLSGDVFAASYCNLRGGVFIGGQTGVQVRSNSNHNVIHGATATDCSAAGFSVATGSATTINVGSSFNKHVASTATRCVLGFSIGDGTNVACDGNEYTACEANASTSVGFVVSTYTTGTILTGCIAQGGTGSAVGYQVAGPVTMTGCRSSSNAGRGLTVIGSASALVSDYTSRGDAAALSGGDAVKVQDSARLVLRGARLEQNNAGGGAATWNGYRSTSSVDQILSAVDVVFDHASAGYGIIAQGSGVLYLRDVVVSGTSTGNTGLYAGGPVEIGPGCSFGGMATAIDFSGGGAVTMTQVGGVAAVSATGSLTFAQHYNTAIELASGASADSTITTYPLLGAQWVARNLSAHNLVVKTTTSGDTGITVAAGKTAIVAVRASDSKMSRVTADV